MPMAVAAIKELVVTHLMAIKQIELKFTNVHG
jgi:hypothetical protein